MGDLLTAANDQVIRQALESAGVEFIDENGGGPGVRSRQSRSGKNRRRFLRNEPLFLEPRRLSQASISGSRDLGHGP
jgi:hypothetical protein